MHHNLVLSAKRLIRLYQSISNALFDVEGALTESPQETCGCTSALLPFPRKAGT